MDTTVSAASVNKVAILSWMCDATTEQKVLLLEKLADPEAKDIIYEHMMDALVSIDKTVLVKASVWYAETTKRAEQKLLRDLILETGADDLELLPLRIECRKRDDEETGVVDEFVCLYVNNKPLLQIDAWTDESCGDRIQFCATPGYMHYRDSLCLLASVIFRRVQFFKVHQAPPIPDAWPEMDSIWTLGSDGTHVPWSGKRKRAITKRARVE